jgi:hypothetical protein
MNATIRKRIMESDDENEVSVQRKKHSVDVNPVVPEEKNQYEAGTSLSIKNPSNSSTAFNIPIVKESDTENLCYFYAAFNALPTISQKYAFCANNFDNPSAFFLDILQRRSDYNIKKHEEGFNPTDMLLYLKALRDHGFINDFQWKKKDRFTLNKIFFGNAIPLQTVYLISG